MKNIADFNFIFNFMLIYTFVHEVEIYFNTLLNIKYESCLHDI